ncbi:MAG: putative Ig domain-containing protein, partial [Oscillospiraceae bacterium]|nr:putative Ig domain-containing protein [Oscillospiraceae bacterium]
SADPKERAELSTFRSMGGTLAGMVINVGTPLIAYVVVDGKTQKTAEYTLPYHYDGDGKVKLIDVDAAHVYDATDIYRRTLVSVDASDEVSYTVDFFRILGGNEHMYSFHTQSANGYTTDDLTLVPQKNEKGQYIGSYAGANVPYGEDPGGNPPNNTYPTGFTWLKNVNLAENPRGSFSVNFKQTDFRKLLKDSKGLNLKFTALNDWTPSRVGIAAGLPPLREDNLAIPHFDYMMIHRKAEEGKTLDTLFTSVIQPYKGEEYIESMKSVPLTCKGTEGELDVSRAVKVKLKSGRTDYIIYATNNELTYTLTDGDVSFDFNGFVGVYSVNENGKNVYSYVNDGTTIAGLQTKSRYTGKVKSFTDEILTENEIVVTLDQELSDDEIKALAGEYVYIESNEVDNASYKIEGASKTETETENGTEIALDIGGVTLVRSYKSITDFSAGYNYNIAADRSLYIPLSAEMENKPMVVTPNDLTTSAGSSVTVQISAESADGESLTYIGTVLPRGASINSETGKITWKPDGSQVGETGFFITVRDESGRENTTSFEVTVYGSTTGSGSKNEDSSGTSTENAGTIGGGGGGGGGAAPENPGTSDKTDTDKTEGGEKSPEASGETDIIRFTDLGNYAWAADAINSLAD